jgi:hypothetical protein
LPLAVSLRPSLLFLTASGEVSRADTLKSPSPCKARKESFARIGLAGYGFLGMLCDAVDKSSLLERQILP